VIQQNTYSQNDLLEFMCPDKPGAKLPSENMSMIDQVLEINTDGGRYSKGEVIAEFKINPDKWFFSCHFPGDPVMPGCLGLDALWQLSGFYLSWAGYQGKGRALGSDKVKFFGEILPNTEVVKYHVHVRRLIRKGLSMIVADGEVFADGKHIYTAEKLRVALLAPDQGL